MSRPSIPSLPSVEPGAHGLHVTTVVGSTGFASSVIVCGRTRVAAIVDPRPENRTGIAQAIGGARVRFELFTSTAQDRARNRLAALTSGIGLAPRTEPPAAVETGCLRVVPTGEISDARYTLAINARLVRVGFGQDGLVYTVRGEIGHAEVRAERIRLAFGAWHIELFPLFWSDGISLAYTVDGRVWFGGSLRSPGRLPQVGERVLPLDRVPWGQDDLLYPSQIRDGLCVGTLRQERLVLAEAGSVRVPGTFRDQELAKLAGVDGLLTPVPDDGLERELVPRRGRRPPDSEPPLGVP